MAKSKFKSTKRFGTRYGRTLKERVGKIEDAQKKKHTCPYCNLPKVRRLSVGIWACSKCGAKFTARAYKPEIRKITIKSKESIIEGIEEQESLKEE